MLYPMSLIQRCKPLLRKSGIACYLHAHFSSSSCIISIDPLAGLPVTGFFLPLYSVPAQRCLMKLNLFHLYHLIPSLHTSFSANKSQKMYLMCFTNFCPQEMIMKQLLFYPSVIKDTSFGSSCHGSILITVNYMITD